MRAGYEGAGTVAAPSGARLLALLLFLLGACDECWYGSCDDFTCRTDSVVVVTDETKVFPPFPLSCHPWSGPKAVYTVEVRDTTIVAATIDDRQLLITGRDPGETYVFVNAEVEGTPDTGLFAFHVTTISPRASLAVLRARQTADHLLMSRCYGSGFHFPRTRSSTHVGRSRPGPRCPLPLRPRRSGRGC